MAQIVKRTTVDGEYRYDVRTRIGGRVVTRTFKRKKDAVGYANTIEADKLRGVTIDPRGGRVSLAKYAIDWLGDRTDIRLTTRAKYSYLLERHILPALGQHMVGGVSPSAVRTWYMTLRGQHEVTADDAYRLLRAIFNTCVADEITARNPCQVKGAGQVRSPERSIAEPNRVEAAVEVVPERYRLAVLLAAWCHLRRGEILGLQRADLDVERAELHVRRAWTAPMDRVPVLGPPKSDAGLRTVAIPGNVMPTLGHHLEAFVAPKPDAWMFSTLTGTAVSPRSLDRVWNKAREEAGLPHVRLHDLRHAGLTWAADTGASTANLMQRGGHSDPRAALRYQHATPEQDRAIADALAARGTTQPVLFLVPRDGRAMGASEVVEDDQENAPDLEQPQRDSNPCLHLERVMSLATRRWGPASADRR
jgi:integrase